MFGTLKLKIAAYFLSALLVGGTVYAGYTYVTNLQESVIELREEKVVLQGEVDDLVSLNERNNDTITQLNEQAERIIAARDDALNDFEQSRARVRDLESKLSEHDIGFLAQSRPGLVENIINNAMDDVNRCFEISSGAKLTEQELNAIKPSEINSSCPEIANPRYIPND